MYTVFSCINTYLIELSYTIKHPGTEAEEHICNSEKERKISFLTLEYNTIKLMSSSYIKDFFFCFRVVAVKSIHQKSKVVQKQIEEFLIQH